LTLRVSDEHAIVGERRGETDPSLGLLKTGDSADRKQRAAISSRNIYKQLVVGVLSLDGLGAVCAVSARYPGRWLTNGPRKSRVETLAIAFGVASPVDLAAIASRVLWGSNIGLWV
jgi:hypothetical protein